ncbi:hypothetical protein POM88_036552 [Heracleum sosnowskyi]|uniref:Uncharacterized protein n=1 Tax=Heracleum sosnowskyi TaxID=360622 RepID=A0AAD8HND9_9APIA|nr:hypothetical protein POM88_036552 [Heracleum sosnowskyi]
MPTKFKIFVLPWLPQRIQDIVERHHASSELEDYRYLSTLKELELLDLVRISSNLENKVRRDFSSIFQATDQPGDIEKWFAYIFKAGLGFVVLVIAGIVDDYCRIAGIVVEFE